MNFSLAIIMKNEEKTLPKLAASLQEFKARGGEMVALDTGSTDNTVQVAKELGFIVHEVGDRFVETVSKKLAEDVNAKFVHPGEEVILQEGTRIFNYAAARNYAASLCSKDMVAMPDADEAYTKLDLEKINEVIANGAGQLEYNFVFSHDQFGNEAIKFLHCKFYDRTKLQWKGIIHEVLTGEAKRQFLDESICKLEHFQNQATNRNSYLTGLSLDCFLNPENDRNSHYFGRELLWKNRPKSAIIELQRHLTLGKWPAERAQSMIFMGDAYMNMGDPESALMCWNKAYAEEGGRREPLVKLAWYYYTKNDAQRVAAYCEAMLTIPWNNYYANDNNHYTALPHELLYWSYWQLGNREKSKEHFDKAFAYQPKNRKYLMDRKFYYAEPLEKPLVSIIIPTLGRTEKLKKLLTSIENTTYPNYEVIVFHDGEEMQEKDFYGKARAYSSNENAGVPEIVKRAVAGSNGELVMFLGNDCTIEPDTVKSAVEAMYQNFGDNMDGLVGLNDGFWKGEIATHWLASKKLLPYLNGEFFHTGYHHVGCDNELTEMCRKIGKYAWAENAIVHHDHFTTGAEMDETYTLGWSKKDQDRELLNQRSKQFGFNVI